MDEDGTMNKMERAEQMKLRTKQFALRVITMLRTLPPTDEGRIIGRQVLRSGTSVGANYRAVCRARSTREFVAKMGTVVEEADETAFWLELLVEAGIVAASRMGNLIAEANELLRIFAASHATAQRKLRQKNRP